MTCRHCGARIGILERWRYGDFCSREHKQEFSLENERLAEEILRDLRRPEPAPKPVPIQRAAALETVEPEPPVAAEPPDPDMAGIVAQEEASPLRAASSLVKEEPPKAKPGWKEFASLADLDRASASAPRPTGPPRRQIWIEEPAPPPGPYSRTAQRPLGLPAAQYRRRRPGLKLWDHLLPIEEAPGGETRPASTAVELWDGWTDDTDQGWTLDAGAAIEAAPGIGVVLSDYPITAPWDRWEKWPVAAPAALPHRVQDVGAGPAPRFPASPGGGFPASPGAGFPARTMPALQGRGAGAGAPVAGSSAAGAPAMGPFPAGTGPGGHPSRGYAPGGGGMPALPAGGGYFGGGPMLPGPALPAFGAPGGVAHGGGAAQGGHSAVWREMAPPMFLAQADPAVDLNPLDRPLRTRAAAISYVHSRPRVFRPQPHLLPPAPRVPVPPRHCPVALRLADGWTPRPPEPVRWRP
jgi:hypothetical protein